MILSIIQPELCPLRPDANKRTAQCFITSICAVTPYKILAECPRSRGPGADPLVRGSKPPETESFLALADPKRQICTLLFADCYLKQGFCSTRTPHFRAIRLRNYALLWLTMGNATHFCPGSLRSIWH